MKQNRFAKSVISVTSHRVDEGRTAARDEATLRQIWVDKAEEIIREKEARKREKAEKRVAKKSAYGNVSKRIEVGDESDEAEAEGDEVNEEAGEGEARVAEKTEEGADEAFAGQFSLEQCVSVVRERHQQRVTQQGIEDLSSGSRGRGVRRNGDAEYSRSEFERRTKSARYQEILQKRQLLPAYAMKDEILRMITDPHKRVLVVSGDTGCGKTTQIPQLVLDDAIMKKVGVNIVVTQPRRISAISVAERIAQERLEQVGQTIGYHVRLEAKKSAQTKLTLLTTGILLRRLQLEGDLADVTHVFVDEVHERDINTDFLLIVLRSLLAQRKDLKVILMSATINADLFANYFQKDFVTDRINIPGRAFPVTTFFLEDALEHTGLSVEPASDCVYRGPSKKKSVDTSRADADRDRLLRSAFVKNLNTTGTLRPKAAVSSALTVELARTPYSDKTLVSLEKIDEEVINKDLIRALVVSMCKKPDAGAILVFVPGLSDIRDVIDAIRSAPEIGRRDGFLILPLHSSLSTAEQARVFTVPPAGVRKIVVSTNIAETSVTIEDVVFVIDTCRVKENRYDETSKCTILDEMWTSQANTRQRRGRAGRVRAGICYHLTSSYQYNKLPAYVVPEMLRVSLEDLVLQILALDLGDPFEFLGSALSPPDAASVQNAIQYLEALSAVYVDYSAEYDEGDESVVVRITPLGFHLAAMPLSPSLGKLMLYGVLLKCIDPVLTIAAISSSKNPFVYSFEDPTRADEARLSFLEGDSDLLTTAKAYEAWRSIAIGESTRAGGGGGGNSNKSSHTSGRINAKGDWRAAEDYCRLHCLSPQAMQSIHQIRGQFLDLLIDIGFLAPSMTLLNVLESDWNRNGNSIDMIKCVVCAGLGSNFMLVPEQAFTPGTKRLPKRLSETPLTSNRGATSEIFVHPSSVLSNTVTISSPYMVFLEAVLTSKLYARDVTSVSPLMMVLFGGRVSRVGNTNGKPVEVLSVDDWLHFSMPKELSMCILALRDAVEEAFIERVLDPAAAGEEWSEVLSVMEELVEHGGGDEGPKASSVSSSTEKDVWRTNSSVSGLGSSKSVSLLQKPAVNLSAHQMQLGQTPPPLPPGFRQPQPGRKPSASAAAGNGSSNGVMQPTMTSRVTSSKGPRKSNMLRDMLDDIYDEDG